MNDNVTEKPIYNELAETPIPKLVIKLGIPTTISMLVTSIYNMADTYFVGDENTSASGAVGVVFGLMSVIQAFGFLFGQGSGVLASRALGAGDKRKADKTDSTGLFLALLAGTIIGVFGLIFLDPFMRLLGSTETILPYAREYSLFILIAAPLMCASCVLNNILRFEGKAVYSMVGLVAGGLLNIFGDYVLVRIFKMSVMGAGISTAVSQVISFFLLLLPFLKGDSVAHLSIRDVTFNFDMIGGICKTGLPSLIRQGMSSLSTMMLNNGAKIYGDAAVSAMSIVNRVCFFTFATALGIGQGFQPVAAFNYGAKKYKRVQRAYAFTVTVGGCFLTTVAILGIIFSDGIVGLFRNDPEVIKIGTSALKVQFIGQLFEPVAVCSNMLFQSTGKTREAAVLSLCRSGLFFIPVLSIGLKLFGLPAVQYSQSVADVMTFLVAAPMGIRYAVSLGNKEQTEKNM